MLDAIRSLVAWTLGELDQFLHSPASRAEERMSLRHRDGWTALAFRDFPTGEPGAGSVFLLEGHLGLTAAAAAAQAAFPGIWSRFDFAVR